MLTAFLAQSSAKKTFDMLLCLQTTDHLHVTLLHQGTNGLAEEAAEEVAEEVAEEAEAEVVGKEEEELIVSFSHEISCRSSTPVSLSLCARTLPLFVCLSLE